jgi:hypothetical protein
MLGRDGAGASSPAQDASEAVCQQVSKPSTAPAMAVEERRLLAVAEDVSLICFRPVAGAGCQTSQAVL